TVNGAQDDQQAAFALGEIAAYTDTSSGVGAVISKVDFEVGTAIGVSGTGAEPVSTVSGACLVIYEENDQNTKNAAFQWATYLTNAENSATWSVSTCMFPTHESCDISAMYEKYPGAEGVFDNADQIIGKNKSPAMQSAMEVVAGAVGEYVKGNVSREDFDSMWANTKKEVDGLLADA
ncbi:MAG: extracellular solute-binding protein, partial [Oscillospiraceae bacterium]|nr:extracellular solute-binding protein [Oscillospiraceae bacterium]